MIPIICGLVYVVTCVLEYVPGAGGDGQVPAWGAAIWALGVVIAAARERS
jgi:hypothetical protein